MYIILLRARAEKGTLLILFFWGLFWKKAPSALRLCPYGRAPTVIFGPVGRSADPVFENFGLSFLNCFDFFGVWGAWMLIRNCPIRRCGHFDRTILSGVEIFGYF